MLPTETPAALLPDSAAPFTAPVAAPAAAPVNTELSTDFALARIPLADCFRPDFLVLRLEAAFFVAPPLLADFRAADFVPPFEALAVDFFPPLFLELLEPDLEPEAFRPFLVAMCWSSLIRSSWVKVTEETFSRHYELFRRRNSFTKQRLPIAEEALPVVDH